jgi:hypothetical protein
MMLADGIRHSRQAVAAAEAFLRPVWQRVSRSALAVAAVCSVAGLALYGTTPDNWFVTIAGLVWHRGAGITGAAAVISQCPATENRLSSSP